ncbi:tetratricopeptide repeat protein [Brachyspira intermedia]|uniref:tetratricopeptide repeat protein n=1 Tax=Brachyspira intermedia TaxID=84377 RepID=UPI0030044C35
MSVVNDNDSGRDSKYYFDRANIFSLEGKYEEAIVYYNKAIELDPNYTDAYNGREKAKNDLGKYEDSIKDFNKVIELTPNYTNAYYDRGNAKKKIG